MVQVVNGQTKALHPPLKLEADNFKHTFKDSARALKLVTFVALFPALNDKLKEEKEKTDTKKSKKDKTDTKKNKTDTKKSKKK